MSKVSKLQFVPINAVNVDRSRNIRENEGYDVTSLKADLVFRGQQEPVSLERIGDILFPIKGFRRMTALQQLVEEAAIDPKMGKPFKDVQVLIYEGLDDKERMNLLLDHGQRRGLNKSELFEAFCRGFDARYGEMEIVILLRDLLELHYPPTREIKNTTDDKGTDLLNYYKGVLQTAKQAWQAPTVLRQAWVEKLQGKHAWPNKAEMVDMVKVFNKEREADKTNTVSRQNPGPKFLEAWKAFLAKQAEAAANGEKRAKSSAMMNRAQIEGLKDQTDSRLFKSLNDVLMRKLPDDRIAILDKLACQAEEAMGPEWHAMLTEALKVSSEESAALATVTQE